MHQDDKDKTHELSPLCVLDFYVHESCQRTGRGKALFEHMLQVVLSPLSCLTRG